MTGLVERLRGCASRTRKPAAQHPEPHRSVAVDNRYDGYRWCIRMCTVDSSYACWPMSFPTAGDAHAHLGAVDRHHVAASRAAGEPAMSWWERAGVIPHTITVEPIGAYGHG